MQELLMQALSQRAPHQANAAADTAGTPEQPPRSTAPLVDP